MATNRSYEDACGIARALDVVGERWAVLVVRELLLGPQRFADLRRALPKARSNMVADRLRELEGHGVVRRRGTPAGFQVYELTAWGRELEPIVLALGGWGLRVPRPDPATLSATSVLLFLRGSVHPRAGDPPATYRVELDGRPWAVRTESGQVHVSAFDVATGEPVATLRTTPVVLNDLLEDPAALDAALAGGSATVTGDRVALRRLLGAAQESIRPA